MSPFPKGIVSGFMLVFRGDKFCEDGLRKVQLLEECNSISFDQMFQKVS